METGVGQLHAASLDDTAHSAMRRWCSMVMAEQVQAVDVHGGGSLIIVNKLDY
jgi:hypothetical protein